VIGVRNCSPAAQLRADQKHYIDRWDHQRVMLIGHAATHWALEHVINGVSLEELTAGAPGRFPGTSRRTRDDVEDWIREHRPDVAEGSRDLSSDPRRSLVLLRTRSAPYLTGSATVSAERGAHDRPGSPT
jgi:hypothetical protein